LTFSILCAKIHHARSEYLFFASYLLIFLISICFSRKTRADCSDLPSFFVFQLVRTAQQDVRDQHGIVIAELVKRFAPIG